MPVITIASTAALALAAAAGTNHSSTATLPQSGDNQDGAGQVSGLDSLAQPGHV